MKTRSVNKSLITLAIASLVVLPACDWFNKGETTPSKMQTSSKGPEVVADGSAVIVTVQGRPVITEKSLEAEFSQLMQDNPQLAQILPFMPDAKKNFAMGMLNQIVVDQYVVDQGIDKKAEYQKDLDRMMTQVVRMLNTKYFSALFPVNVTDADATKFYEENKDKMEELVVSRGGVKALGVQFDTEQAAKDFLAKEDTQKDLKKAAQAANKTARDFNVVNDQSTGIDPKLRESILQITTFPTTKVIKVDGKTYWVVQATGKEDKKYAPLNDQLKEQIKQYLAKEKQSEVISKEIDTLKGKYDVVVKEEFFAAAEPQQAMPGAMPAMQQQKPATPKPAAPAAAKAKPAQAKPVAAKSA